MRDLNTKNKITGSNQENIPIILNKAVESFKSTVLETLKSFYEGSEKKDSTIKKAVNKIKNEFHKTIEVINECNDRIVSGEILEVKKYRKEKKEWQNSYEMLYKLQDLLAEDLKKDTRILMQAGVRETMPVELKKFLKNQKKSIELIIRMFKNLNEHYTDGLKASNKRNIIKHMLAIPEAGFISYRDNINKNKALTEFCSSMIEYIENAESSFNNFRRENYNAIMDEKNNVEKWRRITISLIRSSILPPIDGIERGLADGKEFLKTVLKKYKEYRKITEKWLEIIDLAYTRINKSLMTAGIATIEPGYEFNPEIHLALGTEESSDLFDGKNFCVIRKGFTYKGIQVRPVEVIVARNKKSSKVGDDNEYAI